MLICRTVEISYVKLNSFRSSQVVPLLFTRTGGKGYLQRIYTNIFMGGGRGFNLLPMWFRRNESAGMHSENRREDERWDNSGRSGMPSEENQSTIYKELYKCWSKIQRRRWKRKPAQWREQQLSHSSRLAVYDWNFKLTLSTNMPNWSVKWGLFLVHLCF